MTPLTLSGVASAQITLSAEANTLRAQALAASTSITAVHDAMDSEACTDALRLVSRLVREVEDARTEAKAPVLALGKQIDKLAKEFSERLTAEKIRLERLNGGFLALQEAKAEAARKIAEAEAAKRLREAAYAAEDAAAKPSAESFAKADAAENAAIAARAKAEEIGLECSEIVESPINGYKSFMITPDGSKEGWEASDKGIAMRAEWVAWMRGHDREEEPCMWVDWAHVNFGGDEPEGSTLTDHSGIESDGQNE